MILIIEKKVKSSNEEKSQLSTHKNPNLIFLIKYGDDSVAHNATFQNYKLRNYMIYIIND